MKKTIGLLFFGILIATTTFAQQSFWDLYCKGTIDQIEAAVKNGADVNKAEEESGYTPLMAVMYNDPRIAPDLVKLLLKAGADPNVLNKDGLSALDEIIYTVTPAIPSEIAKLLIDGGADINMADKYGQTPLFKAASSGNTVVVKVLLDAGASVNARCTIDGGTSIIRAAQSSDDASEIIVMLLKAGAKVDDRDSTGMTALMWAANCGYATVVKTLIDNKASVNLKDTECEYSALMFAAQGRDNKASKDPVETIRLLLAAGANKYEKDYFGYIAYDIIQKQAKTDTRFAKAAELLKP